MLAQYEKKRYVDSQGFSILHTKGVHAGDSTLPYLHYSRSFQLLYFKSGTGSIKVEGRHYIINEGDVVIMNPSELFQCSVDDGEYHERITLIINESLFSSYPDVVGSLFSSFTDREKGMGNRIPAETVKLRGIDGCLDGILEHMRSSGATSQLLAFCKIAELLSMLNEVTVSDSVRADGQAISNPLISDILEYLNLNFTDDIDIPAVAARFNIDKSYLSHLFKEHVGMSLWTYVILRRIQMFNSLIQQNFSIEQSCYRAGFKNYSNFFRLYKKYMKITPTQFKKQIKFKDRTVDTDTQLF